MRSLSTCRRTLRGFGAGLLIGILVGSAGIATAAFGLKGWNTFSSDFRLGYIAGFLEMANITRNLDPGGWVDLRYPYVEAEPLEWFAKVDELYKTPENSDYSITTMMQLAAVELEKVKGKAPSPEERAAKRFLQQLEAVRQRAIAAGKLPPDAAVKKPLAPKPLPPKSATKPADAPEKKWCRCDGKDPKAARAERRAKAAAEESKAKAASPDAAKPVPAPAGKPAPAAGDQPATAPSGH
jgi:hypothetical protein